MVNELGGSLGPGGAPPPAHEHPDMNEHSHTTRLSHLGPELPSSAHSPRDGLRTVTQTGPLPYACDPRPGRGGRAGGSDRGGRGPVPGLPEAKQATKRPLTRQCLSQGGNTCASCTCEVWGEARATELELGLGGRSSTAPRNAL